MDKDMLLGNQKILKFFVNFFERRISIFFFLLVFGFFGYILLYLDLENIAVSTVENCVIVMKLSYFSFNVRVRTYIYFVCMNKWKFKFSYYDYVVCVYQMEVGGVICK